MIYQGIVVQVENEDDLMEEIVCHGFVAAESEDQARLKLYDEYLKTCKDEPVPVGWLRIDIVPFE